MVRNGWIQLAQGQERPVSRRSVSRKRKPRFADGRRHRSMYWMIISNVITFAAVSVVNLPVAGLDAATQLLVIALLPATYHYRWAKMIMFWWTSM